MPLYLDRLNEYRIMWIMVLFDLPTETAEERKIYAQFRKQLLKSGFTMFQFSIYIRHCSSRENRDVHIARIEKLVPEKGHVGIIGITDKQFGDIKIFHGKKAIKPKSGYIQLELF